MIRRLWRYLFGGGTSNDGIEINEERRRMFIDTSRSDYHND